MLTFEPDELVITCPTGHDATHAPLSAAALSCWRKREADTPASARNESISLDDERVTLAELAALTKDKGSKYITAAVPRDAPARLTAASALRDSEVEMLYLLEEFCDETATLLAAWSFFCS